MMLLWDDLRFFLHAARAGTLGAAGQRLGVDAATVSRRLSRLEAALNATVVTRSAQGLSLTAAGIQLFNDGLRAEAAVEAALDAIHPERAHGVIRIGTAEGFGSKILAPALPQLATSRPGLIIELASHTSHLSVGSRAVDIAITLSPAGSSKLVAEPLAFYDLGLYSSEEYLNRTNVPRHPSDLRAHQIVGYIPDLLVSPELSYLDEVFPGLKPTLSSSSIRAQRAMLLGGGGIGVLPCFLGEGLSPVLIHEVRLQRRFWLNTHKEFHGTTRCRIVTTWLRELVDGAALVLTPNIAST